MNVSMPHKKYYLGFDIGGTKCSIVVGDKDFNIHKKIFFKTDVIRGYKTILQEFIDHTHVLFKIYGQENLIKIGISCGGPLDSKKGIIKSPPNLPGWDNVEIVKIFKEEFGVDIAIQNDANACAIAEWMMGAGVGTENMVFLTFGTGMGAGLILNGKIYTGTNDLGGEIGHIRMEENGPVGFGKAGSFEGFCSGGGIAQLAKYHVLKKIESGGHVAFCATKNLVDNITAKSVFEAAISGDKDALAIVQISAEYLGKGLAILIDILNPEKIVIGSIFARNQDLFKPIIEKVLIKEAIPEARETCKIVPAKLGESIGDYAALCVALT